MVKSISKRRRFNTEGVCNPEDHYMVNMAERLAAMKEMVDAGAYFAINRARQFGKTTTLYALRMYLKAEYIVIFLDFQKLGNADFDNEPAFCEAFVEYLLRTINNKYNPIDGLDPAAIEKLKLLCDQNKNPTFRKLFAYLSDLCDTAKRSIVLMIDEVDSATNNQVFLDFLAQLRGYYLSRDEVPIFRSVILAGVHDVRNIKRKIRSDEESKTNSPWNIAAKFNISMSFQADQIAGMLYEYEKDHHTGMDLKEAAQSIYDYTSGYPYLVSAICKLLDEDISNRIEWADQTRVWGREGIAEAVKYILDEKLPLFENMVKYLSQYKDLHRMLEQILYEGKKIPYNPDNESIDLGMMLGFLKKEKNEVAVANRIFEMRFLNLFVSEESKTNEAFHYGQRDRNQFIQNGRLNMELVLKKFVSHYSDIYGDNDTKFIEEYGRKFFLLYLKPIINGTGNYYLEAQTRDARRTDVIVDYLGEQFVVELKIWHGNEYNIRGEEQLSAYLDYYHLDKGYMLSFNFNKSKEIGMKKIIIGDREIVEAVV